MVPVAGLDDVGTDREVLDTYHYASPQRQSQAIGHPVFRDPPQIPHPRRLLVHIRGAPVGGEGGQFPA